MKQHAEIAGAGITGLTSAILLAQRGWTVRVHERDPAIREIGAGIFIKNNGLAVFESMGALDFVFREAVKFTRAEIRDHVGNLIQRRPLEGRTRVWNVPRQAIVSGLADMAATFPIEVVCGSEVVSATPDGEIRLANGKSHTADLVIAADGFYSKVRKSLALTSELKTLSTGCTRALIPRTEFERDDITREFWSGHRRIGIAPCTSELVYCYMAAQILIPMVRGFRSM